MYSDMQNQSAVPVDPLQAEEEGQVQPQKPQSQPEKKKKCCSGYNSYRGHRTVFSAFATFSTFSVLTLFASFSVGSVNSFGSMLSVNGIFSVLSVNSMFSVLSVNSMFSIGCVGKNGRFCWAEDDYRTATFEENDRLSSYKGNSTIPTGTVKLTFIGDNVTLEYDLEGVPANCETGKCGIHIHEGKDCDAMEGHFWSKDKNADDPWNVVKYTSYSKTTLNWGFSESDAKGRALVLHDNAGAKVSCTII